MIRVNRLELLQCLQTVQPGLSPKEIVEQSSCFVFRNGRVITFNDEIACRMKTPLGKDFTGAVQADPLLQILAKLPEDEVDLEPTAGELVVHGLKRQCGIRMEADITLPIDAAEAPGKEWFELHEDFVEAVSLVHECAGKDASQFVLTCVHLHTEWMEACDNYQMTRYSIETGIEKPCLIRRDSLKHIVALDMNSFNETENWIHFKNPLGMVLSCRRYMEEYPDLLPLMDFTGKKTNIPKGIADAVERSEIFSKENDDNQIIIEMKPGKLRIKGVGATGWYKEIKNVRYDGAPLKFNIGPKLLTQLVQKHNECEITADRLKVTGEKWVYCTTLGRPEEKKEE